LRGNVAWYELVVRASEHGGLMSAETRRLPTLIWSAKLRLMRNRSDAKLQRLPKREKFSVFQPWVAQPEAALVKGWTRNGTAPII
tara:strand:- start:4308 stop:4562 length:255 start_codon:yes stop_codon:yes gene_type:complete